MLVMLNTIGWMQDVIVNRTSGRLVDGHLRVDLAIEAGETTVPVKYVDLIEDLEISILTMMNTVTSMAGDGLQQIQRAGVEDRVAGGLSAQAAD